MNIYRQKLLNAVIFFADKTTRLNLTKLSRLLYFLDFMHFKQTGYPSIGLKYYAFECGPVPKDFWLELKDGQIPDDFKCKISLLNRADEDNPAFNEIEVASKIRPDLTVFTPREIKIIENLAFIFKNAKACEMSEVSHLPNQPWDQTRRRLGLNAYVDYLLALDNEAVVDREAAQESLGDHFAILNNFNLQPAHS